MASKPFHLVERAAERLRQEGLLDGMPLGSPPLATPPLPGVLLPERSTGELAKETASRAPSP